MTYQIMFNAVFKFLIVLFISLGTVFSLKAAEPDQSTTDQVNFSEYKEFINIFLADLEDYLQENELDQFKTDWVSEEHFADYQELMDAKLTAVAESSQKDMDSLLIQLDSTKDYLQSTIVSLNARIDSASNQQDSALTRLEIILASFGIIFVAVSVGAGIFGYRTVTTSAQEQAQAHAKKWLNDQYESIEQRMDTFSQKMDSRESLQQQDTEKPRGKLAKALATAPEIDRAPEESESEVQTKAKQTIIEAATALQRKPESNYTFDDWRIRALAAYYDIKFNIAVVYWDKATQVPGASRAQIAKALVSKSVTLEKLEQHEAAIVSYDEIINRYGNDNNSEIKVLCAKTLFDKGIALGELKQYGGAIRACDEVIHRYGHENSTELKVACAEALVGKGAILSQLEEYEDAMEAYSEVINRYEKDNNTVLKVPCAKALFNKVATLLHCGDAKAIETFKDLIKRYGSDANPAIQAVVDRAWQLPLNSHKENSLTRSP
jgi:tetratricopeptide (TPR) repeat protein